MKKSLATLLLSAALALTTCGVVAQDIAYRYLGRINTPSPAFVKVEKVDGQNEFLLISEFGAFSSGKVSVIPNIKDAVLNKKFDTLTTHSLSENFKWPNSVSIVPNDVFGDGQNRVVVPDGFLPPGKTNGDIYIITTSPKDITQVSSVF
jgi:hypothetical protein